MNGGVFLIEGKGKLVKMAEQRFESENVFQELIASYPDLLPGDQIDSENPRRWLLVSREMGIPGQEDETGRWAVDHLFLDQDGIPTLVEIKRSSDTRIRREVVGQMLDYAANTAAYLSVDIIRERFQAACERNGQTALERLQSVFAPDLDEETFWENVKTNIQAGRIRLVFLADEIPLELRRVVEFLSSQFKTTEVVAVEIKQFAGEGLRTLVPRVLGSRTVSSRPRSPWTASEFLDKLKKSLPSEALVANRIMEWAGRRGVDFKGGKGAKQASLDLIVNGMKALALYETGVSASMWLYAGNFRGRDRGTEVLERAYALLSRIEGVHLEPEKDYQVIRLGLLSTEKSWALFEEAATLLFQ